jgi:hypothetical protein
VLTHCTEKTYSTNHSTPLINHINVATKGVKQVLLPKPTPTGPVLVDKDHEATGKDLEKTEMT